MAKKGCCLASQEIREMVRDAVIIGDVEEENIQPSSFDPTIGNECFILDTRGGLFRPRNDEPVSRSLSRLPARQRQMIDISDGFEIKQGASYLFPLKERISNPGVFRFARSSPKSSFGRVFPNTRLLTDYNDAFDEIDNFPSGVDLMSWLLVQPLAFNLIVSPGLSFNQMRFFKGYDARLSPSEIAEEWENAPLLHNKNLEDRLGTPCDLRVSETLGIHLDLDGTATEGIVALWARKNPSPIDLRKKGYYPPEEFFQPMRAVDKSLVIEPGEHYLIASKEVLEVPPCLNVELRSHSRQGANADLHRAGFIDNGFKGDLVFEITSSEPTSIRLDDGMPIGELDIFRTTDSDKVYGPSSGSHYQSQIGPRVAKYFRAFDFSVAAKNHHRLSRDVLVCESKVLLDFHGKVGFNPLDDDKGAIDLVNGGFFHSRYDCEKDDLVLQTVPYILLFDKDGRIFSYVRADDGGDDKDRGETRLYYKRSFGIGGHMIRGDGPDYVTSSVMREIGKDVSIVGDRFSSPKFMGTLYCHDRPVDRVHFGLVFGACAFGDVAPSDRGIESGGMAPLDSILEGGVEQYETWSRALLPHIESIRSRISYEVS
jgi:dCTP deaminase